MTARLPLALLLWLAACAPAPRRAGTFDAADWIARARPAAVASLDGRTLADAAATHTLTAELDGAVGWRQACDAPLTADPQQDAEPPTRGVFTLTDLGPDEHLIVLVCSGNPFQTYAAVVHVVGRRAALLRAPTVAADGTLSGTSAVYTDPVGDGGRAFSAHHRDIGEDCGLDTRYRITGLGTADLVEARARACMASSEPYSGEWPVVYPRP